MRSIKDITSRMGTPKSTGADPYAGGIRTKHGWFSYEELEQYGARETYDSNGELLIQFPYSVTVMGGPMYRPVPAHVVDAHATGKVTTWRGVHDEDVS